MPADGAERHTGAGRFSFLRLRPMSLVESGAGQGGVSLAALTLHLMTYGHFKIENQKFPTSSTES